MLSSGGGGAVRVVICGQGYVGLPLAMEAVRAGHDVVGVDLDLEKVKSLRHGRSYIEDVSDEQLVAALDSGRYLPTSDATDAAGFDVAVISVPTPLRDGAPDLSFIERAARDLGPLVTAGSAVVLESTTYPGTTEELVRPILEEGSGLRAGPDFHLGYSPERLDPGNPHHGLRDVPKIVSGIDEPSLQRVKAFFDTIVDKTVPVSSTRVAEMAKLLENTFRHVNIALVNELAMFADQMRVDVWEAISAAAHEALWLHALRAGPGGRWSLPARRSLVPLVEGEAVVRELVSIHRARQRHQRPDARLRHPPRRPPAQLQVQSGERLPGAGYRARLQAQHGRSASRPGR